MKFGSKKKLEEAIDNYFKSLYTPMMDKHGNVLRDNAGNVAYTQTRPCTMAGLALHLGISRQTLLNYSKEEKFFDTIQHARARVCAYLEERLLDRDGVNGAKFSLINNFKEEGYSDKATTDLHVEKVEIIDDI